MLKEMNRRDFLKATAATGAILMSNELLQGNLLQAQGKLRISEVDKIAITVITDNYYDMVRMNEKIAYRCPYSRQSVAPVLEDCLHAEHGLSYHIETTLNGSSHSCLFDFAADPQGVMKNMALLNIDLKKVEALGLSHDHYDHHAALVEILRSKKEEMRQGIPLYVGQEFFLGTFTRLPDGGLYDLLSLKRKDVENLGFVKIVETKDPTTIIPGAYLTGKIEMLTEYEKIPPIFVTMRAGKIVQEEFIGEQAVIFNVKGKGLVVLSGCAHRGIVNAIKQAQKMTGIEKVHAVIGGFHLTGAKPERIQKTIADIKAIAPQYIVPMHCTGFEAISNFALEMPEQFILNTVGTKYKITA
jgi:7,8-dihydropterin-6-yl-methyl-4-(beta-D-ribofuranosyl)aminobenzene 5'-phosphate synthase